MAIKLNKETALKHATILAAYLLIVWGFYRFLFELPERVEEIFIKPLVWLLPVLYLVKKEGLGLSSLGITTKNLFPAIYYALALGVVFALEALMINYLKYGEFNFSANTGDTFFIAALGLSFITATTEEITFRGYLFNRVNYATNNEWLANISTSVFWGLVHAPITIFVWNMNLSQSLTFLFLVTIFGIGSAFIFARTKNIASSILLHVLWQWPIILFR